jgi:hypothetical protein
MSSSFHVALLVIFGACSLPVWALGRKHVRSQLKFICHCVIRPFRSTATQNSPKKTERKTPLNAGTVWSVICWGYTTLMVQLLVLAYAILRISGTETVSHIHLRIHLGKIIRDSVVFTD